jgi:hypothetical protein
MCNKISVLLFFQPADARKINLDGTLDESSTDIDTEDCSVGFGGPPSPCNVLFEGDNVLINGKSNLLKHPKQHKVLSIKIKYNFCVIDALLKCQGFICTYFILYIDRSGVMTRSNLNPSHLCTCYGVVSYKAPHAL